jgi:hypothetical protein
MAEDEKKTEEETKVEDDTEGQKMKARLSAEGTEDDTEGMSKVGHGRKLDTEGTEDDTEGQGHDRWKK